MQRDRCACTRVTDGERPICCVGCTAGFHLVACSMRQIAAGETVRPWPASVRAAVAEGMAHAA